MADVVMPRLSDSMDEGTILRWLKSVGDAVQVGDELVEIETDKANMAYESDLAGTLTEILAEEGETLPIGAPIARVGDAGEATNPLAGKESPLGPAARASARPSRAPSPSTSRQKASPVARRVAGEKGADLSQIQGTGPGGASSRPTSRRPSQENRLPPQPPSGLVVAPSPRPPKRPRDRRAIGS